MSTVPPVHAQRGARARSLLDWVSCSEHGPVRSSTIIAPNALVLRQVNDLLERERVSVLGLSVVTVEDLLNEAASRLLTNEHRRMGQIDALLFAQRALEHTAPVIARHANSLWQIAIALRARRNGRQSGDSDLLRQLPDAVHARWSKESAGTVSDLDLISQCPEAFWQGLGRALWMHPCETQLDESVASQISRHIPCDHLGCSEATAETSVAVSFHETAEDEALSICRQIAEMTSDTNLTASIAVAQMGSEISVAIQRAAFHTGVALGGSTNTRLVDLPDVRSALARLDLPLDRSVSQFGAAATVREFATALESLVLPAYGPALARAARSAREIAGQLAGLKETEIPSVIARAQLNAILERWIAAEPSAIQLAPLAEVVFGIQDIAHLAGATSAAFDTNEARSAHAQIFLTSTDTSGCSMARRSSWENLFHTPAAFTREQPFVVNDEAERFAPLPDAVRHEPDDDPISSEVVRLRTLDSCEPSEWNGFVGPGPWLPETQSPTMLERYATCPFKYFLSACLGLKVPRVHDGFDGAARGTFLHAVLQTAVDSEGTAFDIPWTSLDAPAFSERVFAVFEAQWLALQIEPEKFPPPARERAEHRRLANALKRFVELEHLARDDGFISTVGTELRFEGLDLGAVGIAAHGAIDRVIASKARDRIRVIDYKTGSSESYAKVPGDITQAGRQLQLALYGLAMQHEYPQAEVTCEYWFLDAPTQLPVSYALTPETSERIATVLTTITNGIRSGFFVPKPSEPHYETKATCTRCEFSPHCAKRRERCWAPAKDIPDDAVEAVVDLISQDKK
ncbi:MAG: PD-(D/E)XK nuclease family protein [Acidimicrobiia bacterium]